MDVYGTLEYSFDVVARALQTPANWCAITPMHINIKACTYRRGRGDWWLTLYSGRKHYQPPADAFQLTMLFRVSEKQADHLVIALSANDGPLLTTNHRMRIEATPLAPARTFVHFSYSYRQGLPARMAIKGYLSTLARDKIGFSTVAPENPRRPVYIQGLRGSLERNAVRYYLAILTYIDTLKIPAALRFEQRIAGWYARTARYPQLFELERKEYLAMKRREHGNQLTLQEM
jgi:hypothetical protein